MPGPWFSTSPAPPCRLEAPHRAQKSDSEGSYTPSALQPCRLALLPLQLQLIIMSTLAGGFHVSSGFRVASSFHPYTLNPEAELAVLFRARVKVRGYDRETQPPPSQHRASRKAVCIVRKVLLRSPYLLPPAKPKHCRDNFGERLIFKASGLGFLCAKSK